MPRKALVIELDPVTNLPFNAPERIWEQWPQEPAKSYRAFALYRDMGLDRSLRRAELIIHNADESKEPWTKIRTGSPSILIKWSKQWQWYRRVQAYDAWMIKEQEKRWEERTDQLREKQWEASETLMEKGIKGLGQVDETNLSVKDVVRLLQLGSQLGMLTKNEPMNADQLRVIFNVLPVPLRDRLVMLLKSGDD